MFAITTSLAIPAELPKSGGGGANALPFATEVFPAMLATIAKDPKAQPSIFVPTSYWVARATKTPEKAKTVGYAKDKLRAAFRTFKDADKEGRASLDLVVVGRTGKEGIDGITEPGSTVWLRRLVAETPKAETPKADEPQQPEAPAKDGKKK